MVVKRRGLRRFIVFVRDLLDCSTVGTNCVRPWQISYANNNIADEYSSSLQIYMVLRHVYSYEGNQIWQKKKK